MPNWEAWLKALITIAIAWILSIYVAKIIRKLSKTKLDSGVMTFLASCVSTLIKIFGFIIALSDLGVNTSVIVGAFSAAGLGISLALKDNMANVAGGIQVLLTRPFVVGDLVQIGGYEGQCTDIEMMTTSLRTYNNEVVVIPNRTVVNEVLVNLSRTGLRRIHIQLPVSNQVDLSTALDSLKAAIDDQHEVVLEKFEPQYVLIGLFIWVPAEQFWDKTCFYKSKAFDLRQEWERGLPSLQINQKDAD